MPAVSFSCPLCLRPADRGSSRAFRNNKAWRLISPLPRSSGRQQETQETTEGLYCLLVARAMKLKSKLYWEKRSEINFANPKITKKNFMCFYACFVGFHLPISIHPSFCFQYLLVPAIMVAGLSWSLPQLS